jgi:sulfatase maturation enzyme AslB (radical SAM superfamily)
MQTALLNLYQKATGSRTINFFIASYNQKWAAKRMHNSAADFDKKWKEEWKQKYFHTKNSFGFNDRFLIPGGEDLSIEEDVLESEDNSPKKLRQAFKKFQNKKQTNRVLLNKMIQAVA